MTARDQQPNGADAPSTYNVIAVSFDNDDSAYQALTTLNELEAQGRLGVEAATVVMRDETGRLDVKDRVGANEFAGAAGGGMIGLLLGVLGGPLGVLLGGTYGLMVGSLVDLDEVVRTESVLGAISASARPGHTALLAQVTEQSAGVVDTAMARLGGTVVRRPVSDVEAEIAAAEKAQLEAQREADRELIRGRRERTEAQVRARVEQLKAKLPRRDAAGTSR